ATGGIPSNGEPPVSSSCASGGPEVGAGRSRLARLDLLLPPWRGGRSLSGKLRVFQRLDLVPQVAHLPADRPEVGRHDQPGDEERDEEVDQVVAHQIVAPSRISRSSCRSYIRY